MSILLLTEVFPPQRGGSGRWLWELYRRLPLETEVVTAHFNGAAEFDRAAPFAITRTALRLPSWGVLDRQGLVAYWRAFREVARRVRDKRPTELHCGKALPEGLLALFCRLRWGIPYRCFVHGEELRLAHTSRDLAWLTKRVLRNAATIVANSVHTERILHDEWRVRERVVVMHPGVDASYFVPASPDAGIRRALGWTGRRVILTVGALQKRKGQDMMLRALPAIRAACPDVLYVMAGDGVDRAYLEALVDELSLRDVVDFAGAPTDAALLSYYQQCDLFALPNRQVGWDIEGFGIVLLEAQACGAAVVAGRSGGTLETIQPGVTGELVACDSPEPLAASIIALLNDRDRRTTMGRAGREWAATRFDWNELSRQATGILSGATAYGGRR